MEENIEQQEAQQNPEDETTSKQTEEAPTPEQIADWKRRAEVSSQNYERLKKAEAKLKELEEQKNLSENLEDEVFTDTEKVLKKEIDSLKGLVTSMVEDTTKGELISQYPILKEKWSDFEEFRNLEENKGLNFKTATKAFLIENDLISTAPKRKGLERPSGGVKASTTPGKMSVADAQKLRETNYRQYKELLMSGKLVIE